MEFEKSFSTTTDTISVSTSLKIASLKFVSDSDTTSNYSEPLYDRYGKGTKFSREALNLFSARLIRKPQKS